MQILAAYLISLTDIPELERASRKRIVRQLLDEWLLDKGATDPNTASGVFKSKSDDPTGRFSRIDWSVSGASLERLRLAERTSTGQIFTTTIDLAARNDRLDLYCTLNVANSESVIAPLPRDAHCPRVIRNLIERFDDWTIDGYTVPKAKPYALKGREGASKLSSEIREPWRNLPIVVVSEDDEGNLVWPYIDEYIAQDLAGLARVVRIDEQATWTLSDEIGKLHSCYDGAIRLYWPPRPDGHGGTSFSSTVWTPSSLAASDRNGGGSKRLRRTLRGIVLSTAAIALSPPKAIAQIQEAFVQQSIDKLKSASDEEAAEIVKLYSDENERLKEQNERLENQLSQLSAHLRATEYALASKSIVPNGDTADTDDADDTQDVKAGDNEAATGEIRYYKKTGNRPSYDRLIEVNDCGHNNWDSAFKADKARKGLIRLTRRDDWDNMWHCSSCTGGGMWKVKW